MSDPKQPSNSPRGPQSPPQGGGDIPPPSFGGGGGGNVPPPSFGGGGNVPPPSFGGGGGAVPPPAFGVSQDVAPPSFLQKKKKEKVIREVIEEVYVDAEPVIDKKGASRRRKIMIVCTILAIPLLVAGFIVGKSRQSWALEDRSRGDAATLAEKMSKAQNVLQDVQSKTAGALSLAESNQVDEGYVQYTIDAEKNRPLTNADLDMLNYAAFDSDTVDGLYDLSRLVGVIWGKMAAHRNVTRQDLDALKSAGFMDTNPRQTVLGAALMKLYDDVYGVNIGIVSNPSSNAEGHKTLDLQVRAGRKSHPYKLYTKGSFGEKARDIVVLIDPEQTAEGGPLANTEPSHMDMYIERLEGIRDDLNSALQLHGELAAQLSTIAE